jgi:hypothetical protein
MKRKCGINKKLKILNKNKNKKYIYSNKIIIINY